MDILQALILGAIQGISEFLPISSSGHLVLLQEIFDIKERLFLSTMLHAGTLLAVITVLRKDIWMIIKRPIQPLTGFLVLATIPAVIAALVFKKPIDKAFETGQYLGFCFLFTSALLVLAEIISKHKGSRIIKDGKMKLLDAVIIGIMQAIAIPPGISRSGATISGALSCKLDRDFAARFSFLMSIPAILGALVFECKDLIKGSADAAANGNISAAAIAVGTITAAAVGFFAVKFMIKIIKERSLYGFAIYTAALGILILIDKYGTHFVFKIT